MFFVKVNSLVLTFACSLLDCQHLHAAHPGLLHGRGGTRTTGETGIKHAHVDERDGRLWIICKYMLVGFNFRKYVKPIAACEEGNLHFYDLQYNDLNKFEESFQ